MKQIALAALLGAGCSGAALAQSTVQIYGVADAGVMWQRGGTTKIISGGADGSRLGFKGSEELGGGYKAVFNIEARVELDTGLQFPTILNDKQGLYLTRGMDLLPPAVLQAVRGATQPPGGLAVNPQKALFDRTSMVGMITPYGAFLLGRLYTPEYEVFAAADTFEAGTAGTWGGILYGTGGYTVIPSDIRSSRSLEYRIVHPSGFGAVLMVSSKGSGYLERYNKFYGVNVTYKNRGWDVGIGYNHGYDQQDAPSLRTATAGGSWSWGDYRFFAGVHYERNTNSPLMQDYILGWDSLVAPQLAPLGAATAGFLRNVFIRNIFANTEQNAISVQAGVQYRYGPGKILASVAHQNDRTSGDSDATLYALGYDYFVSRRTDLYAVGAFIDNRKWAQFSPASGGVPGGFTRHPGDNGGALQVGIRHRF
ncbi:porin [Massilia terrae]|uniref:Porin n=1 Tax=Massilia terrae TaxID=1811224 RepID=A0ABT2CXY4_9BURK|nr:porin [Massilia terrae]MCS0658824.1 porin [Massilia terrae]